MQSVHTMRRMHEVQENVLKDTALLPRAGSTHCSEATYRIARELGVNTAPLGYGDHFHSANIQAQNLEKAAAQSGSGWQEVSSIQEAARYAKQGFLVILAKKDLEYVWKNPEEHLDSDHLHGHTVTLASEVGSETNPNVAQVGGHPYGNGFMPLSHAISRKSWKRVKAYVAM